MKTRIIKYLRGAGNWVEFWFEEDTPGELGQFDACCKNYQLWDIVDDALAEAVLNNGFKGLALVWDEVHNRPVRFMPTIGVRHDYLADLSQ